MNDNRVKKPIVNILLFFLTLVTTLLAGAFQKGQNPFNDFYSILHGIPFSLSLLFILASHELGHYFYAKKCGVNTSLPYFIPGPALPLPFLSIGTFGAVIFMRSKPKDRNHLFDVAASGPVFGFLVSLFFLYLGLMLSEAKFITINEGYLFGESILIKLLVFSIFGVSGNEIAIFLHPVGLAGWIGLLITFLNLLPIGQLDGGHIFYAVFGKYHQIVAKISLLALFMLGILGWRGWFIWFILLLLIGINHPKLVEEEINLTRGRKITAFLILVIFILIFLPEPLKIS